MDDVLGCGALPICAQDNRSHQKNVVEHHVESKSPKAAVTDVSHALIRKGRESCKCAAESGRCKQPPVVMTMVRGPGQDKPHNEAARYIHDEGAKWQAAMMRNLGWKMGHQVAKDRAQHRADGEIENVCGHRGDSLV